MSYPRLGGGGKRVGKFGSRWSGFFFVKIPFSCYIFFDDNPYFWTQIKVIIYYNLSELALVGSWEIAIFVVHQKKLKDMNKEAYREVIGERLKEFRESSGITKEHVAEVGGLSYCTIDAIEKGSEPYTIDDFISYIVGCDLYIFFSSKSKDREKPHDFDDIARKCIENDPRL